MIATIIRILLALLLVRLLYGWLVYPLLAGRRKEPRPARQKPRLKKRMDLTGLDVEDAKFEKLDQKP